VRGRWRGHFIKPAPQVTSKSPAKIEVERISQFKGALLGMAFKLNGEELFSLAPGDSVGFRLDPGTYSIGDNNYYNGDKSDGCNFSLTVKERQSYKIEISPDCQDYRLNGKKMSLLGNN
jgi:hypothetical protein